jgi:hypothetical protein
VGKIFSKDLLSNREVTIIPETKNIKLNTSGNLSNDGVKLYTLYSYLLEQWKMDNELIKHPFPMSIITPSEFKMINGWKWDDDSTKRLIKDGGWVYGDLNKNSYFIDKFEMYKSHLIKKYKGI